jgi:hypothetical protein
MNYPETINLYFQSWIEYDENKRLALLNQCFSENGTYTDPHIPKPVENIKEMNELIKTFQARLPHKLLKISEPEMYHATFRLRWEMKNVEHILSNGTFVGEFDSSNKIARIYCFIDQFFGF